MTYRINAVFLKDKNGYYVTCPELPGCHTQGDTFENAKKNIKEAVELYLETMTKKEIQESLNKEFVSTTLEIAVA